jgi:hypothetical protein
MGPLRESIEALGGELWRCSRPGACHEIFLDPKERRVYLFSIEGVGVPFADSDDIHICSVPERAMGSGVVRELLAHIDQLVALCDDYDCYALDPEGYATVPADFDLDIPVEELEEAKNEEK